MRLSPALVGLAACWSNPPPKAPPPTPSEAAPSVVAVPSDMPAPPRAYRLPASVADALATQTLGGYVIVRDDAQLMATAAAARTSSRRQRGNALLASVVADHGDVVEIKTDTARMQDCVAGFTQPYELTLFVRRDQLVPRTKVEVTKTFPDGTAVAINAGAPVEITPRGLAWAGKLADVPVPPPEDQLTYGLLLPGAPAKLPAQTAEPLVCDASGPRTLSDWRDGLRAKREAEARAREEQRRLEMEAQKAEWERTRPERERARAAALKKCKAKAAAKKKAKKKDDVAGILGEMDGCAMQSIFGSAGLDSGFGSGLGSSLGAGGPSAWEQERMAPYCSIRQPWDDGSTTAKKVAAPKLGGKTMPWPDNRSLGVVQAGSKYLADIDYGCGRARVSVDDESALNSGGGGGTGYGSIGLGSQAKVQVWIPKPGPVTWPDGSPAGRYNGRKRYQIVEERDTRICVRVAGVGELVCHDKAMAKTDMVFPTTLRD